MGYKGLMEQLEGANTVQYDKDIDLDVMESFLSDIGKAEHHPRKFVLHTGRAGADQFNEVFVVDNIRQMVRFGAPMTCAMMDEHKIFSLVTRTLSDIKRDIPTLGIYNMFDRMEKLLEEYEV